MADSVAVDLISTTSSFGAVGQQVLTFSGIGQVTGILLWLCEDGNADHGRVTIGAAGAQGGFVDQQILFGYTSRDAQTPSTDTYSIADSSGIGAVLNATDGSISSELQVNSFGFNTVTCAWTSNPGTGYRIVALGFGGPALIQVGSQACSGTQNGAVTVSCPNLAWQQPELAIMVGVNTPVNTGTNSDAHMAMGFAVTADGSTITQAGHDMQAPDAKTTTSPGQLMTDPASGSPRILDLARHDVTAPTRSALQVTAMTQGTPGNTLSSVEVTTRDLGSAWEFGYIIVATNGAQQFELVDVELAEAASGASITGWTVTPTHILMMLSGVAYAELGAEAMGTNPAGTRAFALTDGTNSYSINLLERNGQATSDTKTRYQAQWIYCDAHAGGAGLRGTLDSLDAAGFTYTSTSWIGSASKMALALVIGDPVAEPVTGETGRGEVRVAGSEASLVRHAGSVQSGTQMATREEGLARAPGSVQSEARHPGSEASQVKGA